jgi:hypothetical protein
MNEKLIKLYLSKGSTLFSRNSGVGAKYLNINRGDILAIEFTQSGAVKITLKNVPSSDGEIDNVYWVDKETENLSKLQELFDNEIDIPSEILLASMAEETTVKNNDDKDALQASSALFKLFNGSNAYSVFLSSPTDSEDEDEEEYTDGDDDLPF